MNIVKKGISSYYDNINLSLLVLFLVLGTGAGARISVGCHLLVRHLEQLQGGLLQVGNCLLDLLGIHVVLVSKFVPNLCNLLLHVSNILAGQLVLELLHLLSVSCRIPSAWLMASARALFTLSASALASAS